MTHGLLVSFSTSPATGPAKAMAAAAGSGRPSRAPNASQAVWRLECSAVLSGQASPSQATCPSSTPAKAKRAWVPPISTATSSFIAFPAGPQAPFRPRLRGRKPGDLRRPSPSGGRCLFAALEDDAHLLEIEVALQIVQHLVLDLPLAVEADQLGPPGGDRRQHHVEMG